jgi:hypothetical protein
MDSDGHIELDHDAIARCELAITRMELRVSQALQVIESSKSRASVSYARAELPVLEETLVRLWEYRRMLFRGHRGTGHLFSPRGSEGSSLQ